MVETRRSTAAAAAAGTSGAAAAPPPATSPSRRRTKRVKVRVRSWSLLERELFFRVLSFPFFGLTLAPARPSSIWWGNRRLPSTLSSNLVAFWMEGTFEKLGFSDHYIVQGGCTCRDLFSCSPVLYVLEEMLAQ